MQLHLHGGNSFFMNREDQEHYQGEPQNNSNYRSDQKDDSYHYTNDTEIGKTIVSDKYPNTIDSFWFAIKPDIIAKPFDFITVEQFSSSQFTKDYWNNPRPSNNRS